MDFSSRDIQLLYGERFFLIEADEPKEQSVPPQEKAPRPEQTEATESNSNPKIEEVTASPKAKSEMPAKVETKEQAIPPTPTAPPIHLLQTGAQAVWKMRPTAQFVVVLRKAEFSNRDLTGLLKNQLLQAQIDPSMVGFGVIPDEAKSIDLSTADKPYILLFDLMGAQWSGQVKAADKNVWPLPPLKQCQTDHTATRQVLNAMAELKQLLN
ncbi:MAG: hypothetical protein AAF927_30780 [Bacteroidota bacterium]